MGHFDFFPTIKNNAETTLLIDEKCISQEVSYTAQQNSRKVKSPKTCIKETIFAWLLNNVIFTV